MLGHGERKKSFGQRRRNRRDALLKLIHDEDGAHAALANVPIVINRLVHHVPEARNAQMRRYLIERIRSSDSLGRQHVRAVETLKAKAANRGRKQLVIV